MPTAHEIAHRWTVVSTLYRDRDDVTRGFAEQVRRYPNQLVAAGVYRTAWDRPTAYVQTPDGQIEYVTPPTTEACDAKLATMELL